MKENSTEHIKIKTAISLKKLLASIQNSAQVKNADNSIVKSYNDIALNADIRKATVSNTFNANSIADSTTLILIIEAMGFSLTDFAKIYDSIKDSEILTFKKS
ncbi:hypothetical protein [Flavobacterium humi]|uniref:XRE family transcriptional regulator n=1 Tax=Flavobacterium humi TaxID=2562683 RepID=A0A4Z0LB62_9FLAO|nr:hypothetical protein [Flavobacterium humi]TGD58967.1 hypothetical protein E4635_03705 [Flavobacterium humi]